MKNALMKLMAVLLACGALSVRAEFGDMVLSFSTVGPDTYSDGTPVADGECYALVYTCEGAAFAGFAADGTCVDAEKSEVVLAAPVASAGRCPPTLFQVRADFAQSRTNGSWRVYLLDTRGADGLPTGLLDARTPYRVNRWGAASAGSLVGGLKTASAGGAQGHVAGNGAVLPADTPHPVVTGISIENGQAKLRVAKTRRYLTYSAEGGEEPGVERDGDASAEIELTVPATAKAALFRVVGKPFGGR